jgi:molybdenum cofactor cytidylyltransferase
MKPESNISGIVLAAGLSSRMGRPKMLLPWKESTVIDQIIKTLIQSELGDILVVTGANRNEIEDSTKFFPVRTVYNPDFENGSMLMSLQTGVKALPWNCCAFLIILGDQPFLKAGTINSLLDLYYDQPRKIIIPSYKMRRGHPWLLDCSLKNEILDLVEPENIRDLLIRNESEISYLVVDDPAILEDMDSPEDYERLIRE